MTKFRFYLVSILFLCLSFYLQAQSVSTLSGSVTYPVKQFSEGIPLIGAVVKVSYGNNVSRMSRTAADGSFTIKDIPTGEVTMSITPQKSSSLNFKHFEETFNLLPGENVVIVSMQQAVEEEVQVDGGDLESAVVSEKAPTLTMRGDTLMYHTAGVMDKLLEGDYAIAALKNMPGVRVENGSLSVFGENVVRTYVNGALIFGIKPLAPFENIKAEEMISFDVYDEDGKTKVANMKTRNPIFSVTDLQMEMALGADESRTMEGNIRPMYYGLIDGNFFSELLALETKVYGTNLNVKPFYNDLPQFRAVTVDRRDLNVDVVFEKYWKSRLTGDALQVGYNYTSADFDNRTRTITDWYASEFAPERHVVDSTRSASRSGVHTLNTSLSLTDKGRSLLTWKNEVSFTEEINDNLESSITDIKSFDLLRREETRYTEDRNWRVRENVVINLPLQFNVSLEGYLQNRTGRSSVIDTLVNSYIPRDMRSDLSGRENNYAVGIQRNMYVNPVWMSLMVTDKLSYTDVSLKQNAFDFPESVSAAVNIANTYDYTFRYLSNDLSIRNMLMPSRSFSLQPNLSFTVDRVLSEERFPSDLDGSRVFVSLNPELTLNKSNRITVMLKSSRSLPTREQMRARINDTNPLYLTVGNPDIRQSHSYNLIARYRESVLYKYADGGSGLTYDLSATVNAVRNPIIQKTQHFQTSSWLDQYSYQVPSGAVLQSFVNAPYSLNGNIQAKVISDFPKLPRIDFTTSVALSRRPRFIKEEMDWMHEFSPSLDLYVSKTMSSRFNYRLRGNIVYSRSSLQSGAFSNELLRGLTQIEFKTVPFKLTYADISYFWTPVRVLSGTGSDTDFHELNMSFGVSLFKQALKVGITGLNLLNSSSVYSSEMTDNNFIQSWRPSFGRSLLLTVRLRLNSANPNNLTGAGVLQRFSATLR